MIRDKKYLASFKGKPCAICFSTETTCGHHIGGAGMALKNSDDMVIGLCYQHHIEELHRHGEKTFFKKYRYIFGDDPKEYARKLYEEWKNDRKTK